MEYEIGDILQHDYMRFKCIIINLGYENLQLLSDSRNIFSEYIWELNNNYTKIGKIDLSELFGIKYEQTN